MPAFRPIPKHLPQAFARMPLFDEHDLERLRAVPLLAGLEYHEELGSTNDHAARLAADAQLPLPHLVLAARQTAGRGRGGNSWWSANGALTFSLLLDAKILGIAPQRLPTVSLRTGLGVLRGLEPFLSRATWHVKWPNDVYLEHRKVCGILAEVPRPDRLVVGIGINVNNSFAAAPPEVQGRAVAMCQFAGQPLPLVEVLAAVLGSLAEMLLDNDGATPAANWLEIWPQYCLLTGRKVEVEQGQRRYTGICEGIDADGALLLATPGGPQRLLSGVVVSVQGLS